MAELHSNIYFKHSNSRIHKNVASLFKSLYAEDDKANTIAAEINPDHGEELLRSFLDSIDSEYGDSIYPEAVDKLKQYYRVHLVNGGSGDYIAGRTVKFLYELCPDIHSQAWGCGDDDPWEYWFRYVDGKLIRCDDEPLMDEEDDARIESTIYRWWHEAMPSYIAEGFLNNQNDEDEDGDEDSQEGLSEQSSSEISSSDEKSYQAWLAKLYANVANVDSSDLVAQGIESPISKDDVSDIMGSLGDLFSMFTSSAKASKNPQENAIDASEVTEELVMQAFNDLNQNEVEFNLDGVLKHHSKKMKGHVEVIDEELAGKIPMGYGMYKMGLAMILKPKSKYLSKSTVKSFAINDDNTASLFFEADAQFIDPETNKLTRSVSDNEYTWSIEDGKLLVTGMISKEFVKELLE